MCGLVACINKLKNGFTQKQLDVFEQLLFLDTLRGDDSTGVFGVNNIGNVGIAKDAITGEEFLKTPTWKEFRSKAFSEGWAMVGHNRKATRGSITAENAHPFWVEDKLVLVHNGSYNGDHKHLKNTAVDSNAIAHVLAEHGANDVSGALKRINAAYAFIWYDVENKRLNVIRNDQRPLSWVETQDAWYFASEEAMLEFVVSRNQLKPLDKIFSFPEYSHNTWTLDENKETTVAAEEIDGKYDYKNSPYYKPSESTPGFHARRHPYANEHGHMGHGAGWDDDGWEKALADSYKQALEERQQQRQIASGANVLALPAPKPKTEEKVTTIEAIGGEKNIPIMPWMPKTTLREYEELRKAYTDGSVVKVIVDDYIESDTATKEVMVTGKVLDQSALPVVFKLDRELLDMLTSPQLDNTENAVFELTVSGCSWRKTDRKDYHDISDAPGIMILRGKQPKMLFNGKGHGCA